MFTHKIVKVMIFCTSSVLIHFVTEEDEMIIAEYFAVPYKLASIIQWNLSEIHIPVIYQFLGNGRSTKSIKNGMQTDKKFALIS